jgi:hypothetical protein
MGLLSGAAKFKNRASQEKQTNFVGRLLFAFNKQKIGGKF